MKPSVKLRKIRASDIDGMYKLFKNDNVLEDLAHPKKAKDFTRAEEKKWVKEQIENYTKSKPKELTFAIIADNEYVGNIGAHRIDYKHDNAEIGYWVGEPYWGKGIATLAAKQIITYLFKRFKLVRISAKAYAHNIGSQRVLEKAGMKYEGTMRKANRKNGKYLDDKLYAIVK